MTKLRGIASYHLPTSVVSAYSLLPPDPDLLLIPDCVRILNWAKLNIPRLQLVGAPIAGAGEQVKRPAVFGACDARAQDDPEVFNVERGAVGERVGRMRTLLAPCKRSGGFLQAFNSRC